MAKIKFDGLEAYQDRLLELEHRTTGICKQAVYEGAKIVADTLTENCPVGEGDLQKSIGLSTMRNEDGFIYTVLGFAGYDKKGNPNVVKARVLENGRSSSKGITGKRPFIRKSISQSKGKAVNAMKKKVIDLIDKHMNIRKG